MSLDLLCIAGVDGRFKQLNPRWQQLLGYSLDELLAEPFLSFVHPDDRESTLKAVEQLSAGQELVSFTNRYRHRHGHYLRLEWNSSVAPDGQTLYALARDVTERDRAAAERRAADERLQHLLASCRVVLYSAKFDGGYRGVTFVSDNVSAQLGYTPSELLRDPAFWRDRIHADDRGSILAELAELPARGTLVYEYRWLRKDGVYRRIHDECKLVRGEGGALCEIVGSWQDVTERWETEQTIRRQSTALLQLSTPLIPISDHVLIMPIIGVVDSRRAAQVMETLLSGITARSARVAILDITGVSIVDTKVADALLRIAAAVRLLGAELILTGIRSEVAQTLVGLGADLHGLVTHGTLQAGIRHAMRHDVQGAAAAR